MKAVAVTALLAVVSGVALGQPVWSPTGGPGGGRLADQEELGGVLFVAAGAYAGSAGVARSMDGGASWEVLDLGGNARMRDLEVLDGTVLAGSVDGEVFASSDLGESWTSFSVPSTGELLELGASDGRVYALFRPQGGFESRLFVTGDMGQSWDLLPAPAFLYSFHAVGDVLLGGSLSGTGFARSTDGGQSWQETGSGNFGLPGFADLSRFATLSDGAILVSSFAFSNGSNPDNGVWRSSDGGASWGKVTSGQIPDNQHGLDVWESPSGVLLLTENSDTFGWRSTDGGTTWSSIGVVDSGSLANGGFLRIRAAGGSMCVSSGLVGVLRSADGGATWARSNDGLALTAVVSFAAGEGGVYAGTGGPDVWRLRGGGWVMHQLPGAFTRLDTLHESAAGALFAATGYAGIFRSFDGGESWVQSNTGVPVYNGTAGEQWREVGVFVGQDGAIYAGLGVSTEFIAGQFRLTGGGAMRSANGGDSWQQINSGLPILGRNDYNEPVRDPMISGVSAGGVVYMGMFTTGVYRWAGSGWQFAGQGLPDGSSVHTITADASYLYCAATFGVVFRRSLEENIWTPAGGLPGFVTALHARGDGVYASVFGNDGSSAVYVSTDHGQSWSLHGEGYPGFSGAVHLDSRCGTLYAGTAGSGMWSVPVRCPGDVDGDGATTTLDVLSFLNSWASGEPCGDFNGDGEVNTIDVLSFLNAWASGC